MPDILTCPSCGKTYRCNPEGDCWCKAYPPVKIPSALQSDICLCSCQLDKLQADDKDYTDKD